MQPFDELNNSINCGLEQVNRYNESLLLAEIRLINETDPVKITALESRKKELKNLIRLWDLQIDSLIDELQKLN